MARVILTCGKLCVGKSTYARKLRDTQGGVILSMDELMLALFPEGAGERHDLLARRTERYLLGLSLQIVQSGVDVILDWGLWTRAIRERVRGFFSEHGVPCELHVLHISDEEWARRMEARNAEVRAGAARAYLVDEGLLRKAQALFEEPGPEEIDVRVDE